MKKKSLLFAAITPVVLAILLCAGPPLAPAPVFGATPQPELRALFEGSKVKIIVGFSPGGGYDISARLTAKHLPKHLPGKPASVIIVNLPGGGGVRSLRALWGAKPDGLTIATFTPTHIMNELTGEGSEFWDTTKQYIGSMRRQKAGLALWVSRDVATSWKEVLALKRPIVEPATIPGDRLAAGAQLAEIMGYPVHVVYGYGGGAERRAAFERGEVTCYTGGLSSIIENFPHWAETKKAVPVFAWGGMPLLSPPQEQIEWLKKVGVTKEPPHIFEALNPSEPYRDAFRASTEIADVGRSGYALPPGVPEHIFQMWKDALKSLSQDNEYIKDMEVAGWTKDDFGYTSVEELMELFSAVKKLDPEGYKVFKKLSGAK